MLTRYGTARRIREGLRVQCHPHPKGKDGPKKRRETCANIRPPSSMSKPPMSDDKPGQLVSQDEHEWLAIVGSAACDGLRPAAGNAASPGKLRRVRRYRDQG